MTTRPELDVEGAWRLRSAAQLDGPSASYWSVWLHNNAPELLRRAREYERIVEALQEAIEDAEEVSDMMNPDKLDTRVVTVEDLKWVLSFVGKGALVVHREGGAVNRLRREDERPSKYVMAMYLQARGWRRRPQRPTEHEPRRWVDPWDCEGDLRVEQAYDLQQRREKGDAGE